MNVHIVYHYSILVFLFIVKAHIFYNKLILFFTLNFYLELLLLVILTEREAYYVIIFIVYIVNRYLIIFPVGKEFVFNFYFVRINDIKKKFWYSKNVLCSKKKFLKKEMLENCFWSPWWFDFACLIKYNFQTYTILGFYNLMRFEPCDTSTINWETDWQRT